VKTEPITARDRVAAKFPTVTHGLFESDYALLVGDVVEIAEAHAKAYAAERTAPLVAALQACKVRLWTADIGGMEYEVAVAALAAEEESRRQ
jgi:hypothetical protein